MMMMMMMRNEVSFSRNLVLEYCMTMGVSYLAHHMAQQVLFLRSPIIMALFPDITIDRPLALAQIQRGWLPIFNIIIIMIIIYCQKFLTPLSLSHRYVHTHIQQITLGLFSPESCLNENYIMAIANASTRT